MALAGARVIGDGVLHVHPFPPGICGPTVDRVSSDTIYKGRKIDPAVIGRVKEINQSICLGERPALRPECFLVLVHGPEAIPFFALGQQEFS